MSCDGVLLKIPPGMLGTKTNVCICRQVKYKFRSTHAFCQQRRIQNISAHQAEIGRLACRKQESLLPGGKVVVANHHVAVPQQPLRQSTADEPGTTGNKVTQLAFLCRLEVDNDQNREQLVLRIILYDLNRITRET